MFPRYAANPTSVKEYSARWGTTFHVLDEVLILKIPLRVWIREMKNKMLLIFATIILASTSLSCFGYAFLEHCKVPGVYRIKLKWSIDERSKNMVWLVILMIILWREPWLKPLSDLDIGGNLCNLCRNGFRDLEFVTSCEFCDIGIMHDTCAEKHIFDEHKDDLEKKIRLQRERRLHDFQ